MKDFFFGDVILIEFPFVELNQTKRRPALVLADTGDTDIIVARITSQESESLNDIELTDWKESGLMISSNVRIHKIATLNKKLISKKLGNLTKTEAEKVSNEIKRFWNI